jgi:GNAT superfamily N-acetyltransferase
MRASNRTFRVRPATVTDIVRLCEFADEFLLKMHVGSTGREARQVFQYVIKHPDAGVVVVAEHKAGICAYAYASFEWRSEFGGETMHCVELFVEQAWRNKGVAGSLLASLIETARERGIHRISAEVHPGNATIERILDSNGFDPEHRTVWGRRL